MVERSILNMFQTYIINLRASIMYVRSYRSLVKLYQ
nr:MAG TPA: hypothetical protein [Bacteriophage sp.]